LDYQRWPSLSWLIRRTLGRATDHSRSCNGNTESFRQAFSKDSVISGASGRQAPATTIRTVGELYPVTRPDAYGMLDVGDGNQVYWETRGNPDGKPAVMVHGGPGGGYRPGLERTFDPARYRLVMFHQRGCGRSRPHASDPATDMRFNTTWHLIADMERLREHLSIDKWLLFGSSWGSTLSLAYAQQHPQRVSEIVLSAVCTDRRTEIDWLYRGGAGRFFPEQWERFVAGAAGAAGAAPDGDIVAAYARLVEDPDPAVREKATADWCLWEDAVLSGEAAGVFAGRPLQAKLALVRICTHYSAHGSWLDDGVLLREAHRLAGIPGVLIHGRLDMDAPVDTAWLLARGWPGAELTVIENAGHLGNEAERKLVVDALDGFAAR
jgi:proline iminopeptidase